MYEFERLKNKQDRASIIVMRVLQLCLLTIVLSLFVMMSRAGQAEGRFVELFWRNIGDENFDVAFDMLSDELKDQFQDSQTFQEDYVANYPIPISWGIESVPRPSISRYSRHLRNTDVRGTLIDSDQQTWRWIIDSSSPIFSRDIEKYRISKIEIVEMADLE